MKYWKEYAIDKKVSKLAKYDTNIKYKLYYFLCHIGIVVPDMYCVITDKPENFSACKQFEKLADARHYRFMLKLKQIKSSIVTKKDASREYEQYLEVQRIINKIDHYSKELQEKINTINDIHKDIRQTFDICSKEFATKHAQEQSYRIYQLLCNVGELEDFKISNERLLDGSLTLGWNRHGKLLTGIKIYD